MWDIKYLEFCFLLKKKNGYMENISLHMRMFELHIQNAHVGVLQIVLSCLH